MNKMCKTHGLTSHSKRPNGRLRCLKCASEAVSRRRRLIKIKAVNYKGGQCNICGYSKSTAALAFHHKDPTQKDFSISRGGTTISWDIVKTELDKCILVCHNCHSELHEAQFKADNPELDARLNNFNPNVNIKPKCPKCYRVMARNAKQCAQCHKQNLRTKIKWPDTDALIKMVQASSYTSVARKLGVSDNSIRKRIKNHPVIK